jgi:hypothetical protein
MFNQLPALKYLFIFGIIQNDTTDFLRGGVGLGPEIGNLRSAWAWPLSLAFCNLWWQVCHT